MVRTTSFQSHSRSGGLRQDWSGADKRAKAFGIRVIYHRYTVKGGYRTLLDLLRESDVVSLHTPLNTVSHQLINTQILPNMRP